MASSLPLHWRTVTLKEVAADKPNAIVDGPFGSNLKTDDYVERGVPVLQGKNITNDVFKWFDVRYITEKKADELKRSSVRPHDILVVKIGSIGYSAVVDSLNGHEFAIIPANLVKVTPNPEVISTKYLHKWLTSPDAKRYLVANASKTAQPALSLSKIKELPVHLPPLSEQRRIAAILDQADALRAKRREALAQLDSLTQSIFIEMFGDPTSSAEGWPLVQLSDTAQIVSGYAFRSDEYVEENAGNIKLCRGANVLPGRLDWSDLACWSSDKTSELSIFWLTVGDIVIAMDRPWISEGFKIAQVLEDDCPSLLVQRVARIRGKAGAANTYLFHLLNHPTFTRYCRPTETTVPHISPKEIRSFRFCLPPETVQRDFVKRIESLQRLKHAQSQSLTELDALFASLQHRAFRGEL